MNNINIPIGLVRSNFSVGGLILILLLQSSIVEGYSLLQKETKSYGYELELDPYYTDFEFYVPFDKKERECVIEKSEIEIYKLLFNESFVPKYLLTEVSVYPFPYLGVYVREHYYDIYMNGYITKDFNWIKSVLAGFEEPWAVSFLVGDLINFRPKGSIEGCSGKAYLGYLLSAGAYHIKDNLLIDDNWAELEWKIKGDKISPDRTMSWSYRVGGKYHSNKYISSELYFSIRRDRVDYDFFGVSLLKNSSVEYKIDFDPNFKYLVSQSFLVGKNFPFKNSKLTFELRIGFILEEPIKYTGPLKRENESENSYFAISPNLKF